MVFGQFAPVPAVALTAACLFPWRALQTGTALGNWTNLATVTNKGMHVEWRYPINLDELQRCFRLIRAGD